MQQFSGAMPRLQQTTTVRPNEPFEQILQRQTQFQARQPEQLPNLRLSTPQAVVNHKAIQQQLPVTNQVQTPEHASSEQEIPDNVTAEIEKLEQEDSMVELQGVGDILGGLGDDEDELLGT